MGLGKSVEELLFCISMGCGHLCWNKQDKKMPFVRDKDGNVDKGQVQSINP